MQIILFSIALLQASFSLGVSNFILISAPGSGKGTFSQYLVEKHGYIQICPGDIFRKEIELKTTLGIMIQPIVEKGEYVDDKITCTLIAEHLLSAIQQRKPFIIDGFPRSTQTFGFLCKFLQENNLVNNVVFLQFMASDETCLKRIAERSVCTQCARVYNASFYRTRVIDRCDACGTQVTKRKADTDTITQKRLVYFHDTIEPLMDLAKTSFRVQFIDSNKSIEALREEYDKLIC